MGIKTDQQVQITASQAYDYAFSILLKYDVPADRAAMVADALVLADLRGVDTHGINRLSGYIERIKCKVLDPNPELTFIMKSPVMAHLDARNTFGFVAGCMSIDKGIEIASTYGFAVIGVKNSNHYGMGSTYVLRAVKQGYGAFAFTNASRAMPPWGGKEALLGTSPLAVGIPGGKQGDFVLDMSPTVAARGKIRKAARRGEPIPEGYALDSEGRPTTDAEAALKGVMLPIGGAKGSALAMMMDIFGGLLTASSFAGDVNDQYNNTKDPQGVGHWFMVFKPAMFLDSRDELADRMDTLLGRVRSCERAEGVDRIRVPGENATEMETRRRVEGIPFTTVELKNLNIIAKQSGSQVMLAETVDV
jgi:LDH2 family malate/lactate/ureidoglycolate dehydrogenase